MTDIAAASLTDSPKSVQTDGAYHPLIFSMDGRLGRVRFIAYGSILGMAFGLLALSISSASPHGSQVGVGLTAILSIPILLAGFVIATRRLNDMNRSGWLSLWLLVPLIGLGLVLCLMCSRGSEVENAYGPPAVPNSTGVVAFVSFLTLAVVALAILLMIVLYLLNQYHR